MMGFPERPSLDARDNHNFWTDAALPRDGGDSGNELLVQTIEGVKPLDAQFGVSKPLAVPTALHSVLFGQSGQMASADVPLHTYAILDADKIAGWPEMLDASVLEHACLLQGEAAEALGDVAPWIVSAGGGQNFHPQPRHQR